jgi:hypothetical protein
MGFSDICAHLSSTIADGYGARGQVEVFADDLRKWELPDTYHPQVCKCLIELAEKYLDEPSDANLVRPIVSVETTRDFLDTSPTLRHDQLKLKVEDGTVLKTRVGL